MIGDEWDQLADRIDALWSPKMTGAARGAYFDVLRWLEASLVRNAVAELARSSRERRPPAGLIYETATALRPSEQREERAEKPDHDVLTPGQHIASMAEIRHAQKPEHARRAEAVRKLGRRLPIAVLSTLLPLSACSAEEFDRRLAELAKAGPEPVAAAAGEAPRRSRRTLLGTDPEDDW